jgi:hypothetical protein
VTGFAPGDAVWCLQGGFPVGARVLAGDMPEQMSPARAGAVWVGVCSVGGQHLPQMYRPAELTRLDAVACKTLGLCPACLGYGTLHPLTPDWYPFGVDELPHPCRVCEGSGRIGLRSAVTRSAGQITGHLAFVPHEFVKPLPATFGVCLGCGNPPDHESHREA